MTAQLALFVEPRARRTDPDTSRAAAQAQTGGVEAVILSTFAYAAHLWGRERGGLTDDDLAGILAKDFYGPTVKTARSRLSKRGLLIDSGARRKSARGRDQIVWRLP